MSDTSVRLYLVRQNDIRIALTYDLQKALVSALEAAVNSLPDNAMEGLSYRRYDSTAFGIKITEVVGSLDSEGRLVVSETMVVSDYEDTEEAEEEEAW